MAVIECANALFLSCKQFIGFQPNLAANALSYVEFLSWDRSTLRSDSRGRRSYGYPLLRAMLLPYTCLKKYMISLSVVFLGMINLGMCDLGWFRDKLWGMGDYRAFAYSTVECGMVEIAAAFRFLFCLKVRLAWITQQLHLAC